MKFNNRNTFISKSAEIGNNVKIGDNTIIYDNVKIGDNTIIANDCVIGEPVNDYYHNDNYKNPETIIGADSLIRSHAIIYAGSEFGYNFSTGHRVTIRENVVAGRNFAVGTLSDIQGHVKFGDYCRLHSNVHIAQKSEIGNFVFIYPYVIFTNDSSPPSNYIVGPKIGDYTQIAVSSVLLPGAVIGENCLIGANSTVGGKFDEFSLIVGNPAKKIMDVRNLEIKDPEDKTTKKSHYPWPYNFDRGMPWEKIGYENWKEQREEND